MPRVLICDKLEPSGLELLRQAGLEVDNRPGLKGDDLKAALRAADGCIVRSGTRLLKSSYERREPSSCCRPKSVSAAARQCATSVSS